LSLVSAPNENISNVTEAEAEKFAEEMHEKTGKYYLTFHATSEEANVIRQAAKDAGMPFGDYLRMKLDEYLMARWVKILNTV
jgi:hypothetical protein